jgi:hypothetical protein
MLSTCDVDHDDLRDKQKLLKELSEFIVVIGSSLRLLLSHYGKIQHPEFKLRVQLFGRQRSPKKDR